MQKIIESVIREVKKKGCFIGKNILYFKEATSSQDIAKQNVEKLCDGSVIFVKKQTKGRGRKGRKWFSINGSLNFTVVLKPKSDLPFISAFPLVAAVSIADAVRKVTNLPAQIKWPNDLILKNKKFCGILCEHIKGCLFLGVGINVNSSKEDIPDEIKETTTSLFIEKGEKIHIDKLIINIFFSLQDNYTSFIQNGPSKILDKWRLFSNTLCKKVKIISGKDILEGIAYDVCDDGSLLIKRQDGEIIRVVYGDVSLRFD